MSLPQPDSLEAATERLSSATLVAEPGTDWNYHNPNYHLAARVVEMVTGEPFERYLGDHVFGQLGMRSTMSIDCGGIDNGLADGHILAYGRAIARHEPDYFCTGSGAVVTSAEDLAVWLILHSGGRPVGRPPTISRASIEAMHASSPASPIYGFGWYRSTPIGEELRYSHTGVMGTFSAYQGVFPGSGYAIAVLQNAASPWADPYAIAKGVLTILQGQAPAAPSRAGLIVNFVLAALTLLTIGLGGRALARTRRWAVSHARDSQWLTALRLVPYAMPVGAFIMLPTIGELAMGRDGTWTIAAFTLPALVVWLAVAAASSVGILVARVWQLASSRT